MNHLHKVITINMSVKAAMYRPTLCNHYFFGYFPAVIFLLIATACSGPSFVPNPPGVPLPNCSWPSEATSALDSTYRWHGLYLGGVERAITAVVSGNSIDLDEMNGAAVSGLRYHLRLTDGTLDDNRSAEGRLILQGTMVTGTVDEDHRESKIDGGSWSFATTDCGTTFHLSWSTSDGSYSGDYTFGPTGYEFDHGANMASCAIYR